MKNLVIVAHPDDETIWMGGYILMNHDCEWEIISLCRKDDNDRNSRFARVCNNLNAGCAMSDLDDEKMTDVSIEEIIMRIKNIKKSESYDNVFTHGKNGEYGHKRHINVHSAVSKMIEEGRLNCQQFFNFAYVGENLPGKYCIVDKNANKFINLPKDVYEKKKHLIKDVYGFNEDSFEVKSAGNIEAFNINKKK